MSGINSLVSIYKQKGEDFLKSLLNSNVTISREIDGTFFSVQRRADGSLAYGKKDGAITTIDRILSKCHEEPIAHFESVPAERVAQMPANLTFCFEYVQQEPDMPLPIGRRMFLTHVVNNDTGKPVHDLELVKEWAGLFGVEPAPVIFDGRLSQDQKVGVLDFVYGTDNELRDKYAGRSFSAYITGLLSADPPPEDMDSVVFRFHGDDGGKVLAKLVDPAVASVFQQPEEKRPNDYMYLIVIDLMNFIESYSVKDLKSSVNASAAPEDNYVSLMNRVFLDFIDRFKNKYLGIEISRPKYMDRPEFDINAAGIPDEKVREIVKLDPVYTEIYRILLNFFRRKRNRPYGVFTAQLLLQFNELVDKIRNVILVSDITEGVMPDFYQFIGPLSEDFNPADYVEINNNFRRKTRMRSVNIVVDTFQPVTNSHVACAELLNKKNGLPVVLVQIYPTDSARCQFDPAAIYRMLVILKTANPNLIADVVRVPMDGVEGIAKALYPKYFINLCGITQGRMGDYLLQLDYAKRKKISYNIGKDFKLAELPLHTNRQAALGAIESESYAQFRSVVPDALHHEFFNLSQSIRK